MPVGPLHHGGNGKASTKLHNHFIRGEGQSDDRDHRGFSDLGLLGELNAVRLCIVGWRLFMEAMDQKLPKPTTGYSISSDHDQNYCQGLIVTSFTRGYSFQ